ncbi:NAD(P)/FAD-dependent oxidoreductase [Yoonia sp. GPGPB17]|uniref:flavin monoamine oxidase family protein n=1 Tax=Yoonia sp. GPGPB17 TaxID=3026147 RepID=UPI0030C11CEE
MHTQTLIVGGGLSGLSLAYRLQQAGHDYQLVEARSRLGGRIKSLDVAGTKFDLGPSWVWPGQTRVAQLVDDLDLHLFEQWGSGDQLYEQSSGDVQRNAGFMSMAGSLRVSGGTSALTDALAGRLDPTRVQTNRIAKTVQDGPAVAFSDGETATADRIVLCLPPRLTAQLSFAPALPKGAMSALQDIPTWMGAHAKFVAVYPTPFWRARSLSGDASSRRGPMVEIHDASPRDGAFGALFGFMGIPADIRMRAGDALQTAAVDQLANLFGPEASTPLATMLEDWSQDPLTATPADAAPPQGHPPYQMPDTLQNMWGGKLLFATTEMAPDNGGLIEGALAAAETAAAQILTP